MKIQGSRSFLDNIKLAGEAKTQEEQLAKDRKDHGLEGVAAPSMEGQLASGRKEEEPALYEKILRKHEGMHAPNSDKEGTTEKRMNEASKDFYPHRNPDAYERTGEKRPVNALPEELGSASDEAKRKRYEKACKPGKKSILDKDVGSQKTSNVFNLHEQRLAKKIDIKNVEDPFPKKGVFNLREQRTAAKASGYVAYRNAVAGLDVSKAVYDEVKELDATLASIMEDAQKTGMTNDARAQIVALKTKKQELLRA
jgi:hypothetical protein